MSFCIIPLRPRWLSVTQSSHRPPSKVKWSLGISKNPLCNLHTHTYTLAVPQNLILVCLFFSEPLLLLFFFDYALVEGGKGQASSRPFSISAWCESFAIQRGTKVRLPVFHCHCNPPGICTFISYLHISLLSVFLFCLPHSLPVSVVLSHHVIRLWWMWR